MAIENIASNLQQRVERASKAYHGVRGVWNDTRRQAAAIVGHNSRAVANTEIGAAKNIYTSAQAAFRRAKRDGLRKVAQHPTRYVPAGRKQTRAAYRATLKLLTRTGSELSAVASGGYRQAAAELRGGPAASPAEIRASEAAKRKTAAPRKRPARRAADTTGSQASADA